MELYAPDGVTLVALKALDDAVGGAGRDAERGGDGLDRLMVVAVGGPLSMAHHLGQL